MWRRSYCSDRITESGGCRRIGAGSNSRTLAASADTGTCADSGTSADSGTNAEPNAFAYADTAIGTDLDV
jgi:hypothetical protein